MTDPCTPYTDAEGCAVTPFCPTVPGTPNYVAYQPVIGWNGGANSISDIAGSLRLRFTMPLGLIGVVFGLRSGRTHQTIPDFVEHAFYFSKTVGVDLVVVMERGVAKTPPFVHTSVADTFEIRRIAGNVTYWYNNVRIYISTAFSGADEKVANACLYASGDNL